MTNQLREQQLLPIRIPIDRGLLGWRLLLIQQQNQPLFQQLPNVQALKQLRSVQGIDWPDLPVLAFNQFNVSGTGSYAGMFKMVAAGRADYFPRSITEIWPEQQQFADLGLSVEQHWLLHYPAPLYFFVRRNNQALAAAIQLGLERALADGSMQTLFLQHFALAIKKAKLSQRQIVQLVNPDLSPETPLTRSELWFKPERGF